MAVDHRWEGTGALCCQEAGVKLDEQQELNGHDDVASLQVVTPYSLLESEVRSRFPGYFGHGSRF